MRKSDMHTFARMDEPNLFRNRKIHLKYPLHRPDTLRVRWIDWHRTSPFSTERRMRQFSHRGGNQSCDGRPVARLHPFRQPHFHPGVLSPYEIDIRLRDDSAHGQPAAIHDVGEHLALLHESAWKVLRRRQHELPRGTTPDD